MGKKREGNKGESRDPRWAERSKLLAPMNFRESPLELPPTRWIKGHLNRLFYSRLYSRTSSPLCFEGRESLSSPTGWRSQLPETETPTFARGGEDNWITSKLETVVSRLSRWVFGSGILVSRVKLTFHSSCWWIVRIRSNNQNSFHFSFLTLVLTWINCKLFWGNA